MTYFLLDITCQQIILTPNMISAFSGPEEEEQYSPPQDSNGLTIALCIIIPVLVIAIGVVVVLLLKS